MPYFKTNIVIFVIILCLNKKIEEKNWEEKIFRWGNCALYVNTIRGGRCPLFIFFITTCKTAINNDIYFILYV